MPDHKIAACVLGATGPVGQKLVALLARHPLFELVALAASPRSAGKVYGEAVHWLDPAPLPEMAAAMRLQAAVPPLPGNVVFSALDSETAREVEPLFAAAGVPVFSNASAFRTDPHVPILVPEVNPQHLALIDSQGFGPGFIVTNPNCSVAGLVLALKPLADTFGVEAVQVTTLQALSGAGYPGVAALDALGNVIPFIAGEEEKIEQEPAKILGEVVDGQVQLHPLRISAQANRVPVLDGHLLSVSVKLSRTAALAQVRECLQSFRGAAVSQSLPSSPPTPIQLLEDPLHPQPRRASEAGGGMAVRIGRLRRCPVLDVRFVLLVHNTLRGAAGGALLNAELAVAAGLLQRPRVSDGAKAVELAW